MSNLAPKSKHKSASDTKQFLASSTSRRQKPRSQRLTRRIEGGITFASLEIDRKSTPKGGQSYGQVAARRLKSVYHVAHYLHERGDVLSPGKYALALANLLSSVPARKDGSPANIHLSVETLTMGMLECGFDAERESDLIDQIVEETLSWRAAESFKIGKAFTAPMSSKTIAQLLGVTEEIRLAAKAYNLGARGKTSEDLARAHDDRAVAAKREKRRDNGMVPREQYREAAKARAEEIAASGVSRRTLERRRKAARVASLTTAT